MDGPLDGPFVNLFETGSIAGMDCIGNAFRTVVWPHLPNALRRTDANGDHSPA